MQTGPMQRAYIPRGKDVPARPPRSSSLEDERPFPPESPAGPLVHAFGPSGRISSTALSRTTGSTYWSVSLTFSWPWSFWAWPEVMTWPLRGNLATCTIRLRGDQSPLSWSDTPATCHVVRRSNLSAKPPWWATGSSPGRAIRQRWSGDEGRRLECDPFAQFWPEDEASPCHCLPRLAGSVAELTDL